MNVSRISRLVALTLATLGVLGLAQAASSQSAGSNLIVWVLLLVVGAMTVYGLKSDVARIPAVVLNTILIVIGIYLLAVTPEDIISIEIRRMLAAFCLVAGGVDCVGLLSSRKKPVTESSEKKA